MPILSLHFHPNKFYKSASAETPRLAWADCLSKLPKPLQHAIGIFGFYQRATVRSPKGHYRKAKGPQSSRDCGPFAPSFGPFSAFQGLSIIFRCLIISA